MYRSPWLAVAVYARAPAAEAPIAADIAANSDSTRRYSHGASSPVRTMSESASTMWVCGEIGYALTTSGRQRATARATACEPSSCSRTDDAPFTYGVGGRERGGDVPLGRPAGEAPANRIRDRLDRDDAGQRREPAEQRGVRQRPAEVLPCELRRGDRHDTLGAKAARRELVEPELVEAAARVDQDVRLRPDPAEEVDLVEQRRVLHDQRVGLDDRLAGADRSFGDAAEGRHRRTCPLRPERRERERVLALRERRHREKLGRRDDSLPATPVDANFEHADIVDRQPPGAHQRDCGFRSVVPRGSSPARRRR